MSQSLQTRWLRLKFNLFPAYRGTGARITYIAKDLKEVRVKLPLNWRTNNYVGSIFGGSMYGAVDPIYMIMLIKLLGKDYLVWDKSATIEFKKPGRTSLYARFVLADDDLQAIRKDLESQPSILRTYNTELLDAEGVVHASFKKVIYIRKKNRA